MTPELLAQGAGYAFALFVGMAAAFWWGWDVRARLAEKLEYFRITNREWHRYDDALRSSRTKRVPMRAQLHEIGERQSEK